VKNNTKKKKKKENKSKAIRFSFSLATHGEEEPRHRVPPHDGLNNWHPALRGGERSIG